MKYLIDTDLIFLTFSSPKFTNEMKVNSSTNPFCMIFGHNYFVQNKQDHDPTILCTSCKKEFILNATGEIFDPAQNQLDSLFSS